MKLVLSVVSNQAAEGLGIEDEDVDPVLAILRSGVQTAASRKAAASAPPGAPNQPSGRGAVFVLPLEGYFHL